MSNKRMWKISTKELCVIAMLLALTVVLSWISGYLRIGTFMKFSVSFISVYIAAMLYGPLAGGFVGAAADIISCVVVSLGVPVWELTLTEFFYGILFGVFFCRGKFFFGNIYIRVLLCSLIRFLSDLFIKTEILADYGYVTAADYRTAVLIRAPGCLGMLVLTVVVLLVSEKYYAEKFMKMVK